MKKRVVNIFGFFLILGGLFFTTPTFAADCVCEFQLQGENCNTSKTIEYANGDSLNLEGLVTDFAFDECSEDAQEEVLVNMNNLDQAFNIGADNCAQAGPDDPARQQAGGNYSLSLVCQPGGAGAAAGGAAEGAAPAAGAPTGGAKKAELRTVKLPNPLQETSINRLIGRIIGTAMGLLGSLALAVFVYGGFMFLTSGGNDEKVKKGTNAMLYAAIGVFLVLASYVILREVFTKVF